MKKPNNHKKGTVKTYTRRDFIKWAGAGAGSVLAAGLSSKLGYLSLAGASSKHELKIPQAPGKIKYAPPPIPGVKFGMVIDAKACIGCRKCVYACVKENNIDREVGQPYIKVLSMEDGTIDLEKAKFEYTEGAEEGRWYLPIQCQQCANPPCVHACPVTATWQEPDGIIVVDYNKCVGCRYCMMACPYYARHFNWTKPHVPKNEINPQVPIRPIGVVEKCTFCIHRTRRGKTTRCTEVCPVKARKFGDLNDPNSSVSKFLKKRRPFRLKEELGTEPKMWFLG